MSSVWWAVLGYLTYNFCPAESVTPWADSTRPHSIGGAHMIQGWSVHWLIDDLQQDVWAEERRHPLSALLLEFRIEEIQRLSGLALGNLVESPPERPGQQLQLIWMKTRRMGKTKQRCTEKVGVGAPAVPERKGERQTDTQVRTQAHNKATSIPDCFLFPSLVTPMLLIMGHLDWAVFASYDQMSLHNIRKICWIFVDYYNTVINGNVATKVSLTKRYII